MGGVGEISLKKRDDRLTIPYFVSPILCLLHGKLNTDHCLTLARQ